jgi:hypothetical protein
MKGRIVAEGALMRAAATREKIQVFNIKQPPFVFS